MRLVSILLLTFIVSALSARDTGRIWVFFKDKGQITTDVHNLSLSKKALDRREMRGNRISDSDLPVYAHYISDLNSLGVTIYRKSRWFNAVSVYLNDVPIRQVRDLPFVQAVGTVYSVSAGNIPAAEPLGFQKPTAIAYGPSFNQNEMIGVPEIHELGYTGQNVRIALFDTGFRLAHEALQGARVVDTYDFVHNDPGVTDDDDDVPGQHNHGTMVMAVIGGYTPGKMIGPAFDSEYLLAKTEDIRSETHVEEDNWVAAAEWADSLGADIISSSLGYSEFDVGEADYTYADMDGKTTIITRAAVMAVQKGIAVFTSAGNQGTSKWYYITAPADGDGVIAVGGVYPDGTHWPLSSRGPTADGRIKPDLMAQGQGVYSIIPGSSDLYATGSGTSFSSPLAAGAGALLLSMAPQLSPGQLRELMLNTATRYENPDNDMGYGLIDLEKAAGILQGGHHVTVENFEITPGAGENLLNWNSKDELLNQAWIVFRKQGTEQPELIAEIDGELFSMKDKRYSYRDTDIEGGISYMYTLASRSTQNAIITVDSLTVTSRLPSGISLEKIYPNPFNLTTTILFGLKSPARVELKIYDILGREVRTLISGEQRNTNYYRVEWDGRNNSGDPVSTGNYIVFLRAGNETDWARIVLIK